MPNTWAVLLRWSMATESDVKPDSKRLRRSGLFQAQGFRGAHVRGAPSGYEGGDKGSGGEDQGGGGYSSRVSRSDAEQLGLDELAESGHARQRNGDAGGDHDDGIAQHEAD